MLTDCQAWTGAVILRRQSHGALHAGLGRDHKHGGSDGAGAKLAACLQGDPQSGSTPFLPRHPVVFLRQLACLGLLSHSRWPCQAGFNPPLDKGRRRCLCAPNPSKKMQYSLKMPLKIPPTASQGEG